MKINSSITSVVLGSTLFVIPLIVGCAEGDSSFVEDIQEDQELAERLRGSTNTEFDDPTSGSNDPVVGGESLKDLSELQQQAMLEDYDSSLDKATASDEDWELPEEPAVQAGSESLDGFEPFSLQLTQGGQRKVDILWVVDSSGSMREEQKYLGDSFNAFISGLSETNNDFQTAVTTTDICFDEIPGDLSQVRCPHPYDSGSSQTHLRGSFVGESFRTVLTSSDPDLLARFNDYTNVGIGGSSFEHGLKAVELAVEKSLDGRNESLVREDAFLAVIVVSDEEDDGIGLSMPDGYWKDSFGNPINFAGEGLTTFSYTEDDLISYLNQVKGVGNFAVSTIASTRDSSGELCRSTHSQPREESTQYIAAARKTGGIVQSICKSNWSDSLGKIGFDIGSQVTQIDLGRQALASTIRVTVEGKESSDWSYIPATQTIKFDAGSIPPTGAEIEVEFWGVPDAP